MSVANLNEFTLWKTLYLSCCIPGSWHYSFLVVGLTEDWSLVLGDAMESYLLKIFASVSKVVFFQG